MSHTNSPSSSQGIIVTCVLESSTPRRQVTEACGTCLHRPAFARAPGQAAVSVPAPVAAVPSAPVAPAPAGWGTGAQGTISLAERLRRQNAAESAQARPEGPPAPGFPAQQQQQPPPPPPAQQQRQAVPTAPNGHTQVACQLSRVFPFLLVFMC